MNTEINHNLYQLKKLIIDTQMGFFYTFPIKKRELINQFLNISSYQLNQGAKNETQNNFP